MERSATAESDPPPGRRFSRYPPAIGCTSLRTNGEPCRRLAVRGARVCYVHGGQLPVVRESAKRSVEAARQRVLSLADPALDVVEKALSDPDARIRLKAAVEVLERVVPRQAALQLSVGTDDGEPVKAPSEIIRERLDKLKADADARASTIRQGQQPASRSGLPMIEGDWSTSDI